MTDEIFDIRKLMKAFKEELPEEGQKFIRFYYDEFYYGNSGCAFYYNDRGMIRDIDDEIEFNHRSEILNNNNWKDGHWIPLFPDFEFTNDLERCFKCNGYDYKRNTYYFSNKDNSVTDLFICELCLRGYK